MILLNDRAILEISGSERKKFLQGLITNDIEKASESNLIYSAMLNAQGRFLYDFFIFENGEKLILDCFANRRDEIAKKLGFYKLRSQVEIKKNDELRIFFNQENQGLADPRTPNLGHRLYTTLTPNPLSLTPSYHHIRISLKIPESEHDLTYEKSFILEFGFDDLNAIDYTKGCYVGQELTARTHYRGEIRKKIFHIMLQQTQHDSEVSLSQSKIEKNTEIYCEGKSVGVILSSILHQNELHALALIKDHEEVDLEKLDCASHKISIVS